jgi:hypothetical protein
MYNTDYFHRRILMISSVELKDKLIDIKGRVDSLGRYL